MVANKLKKTVCNDVLQDLISKQVIFLSDICNQNIDMCLKSEYHLQVASWHFSQNFAESSNSHNQCQMYNNQKGEFTFCNLVLKGLKVDDTANIYSQPTCTHRFYLLVADWAMLTQTIQASGQLDHIAA